MSKVTILMPTYNDSKYITRALDSIQNQTYKDYEILICNDGSTDNTEEVIKEYQKNHDPNNQIKYYYEDNQDQLNAIIKLIPHIQGDYIYILHSDDILYDRDTLKKMVTYMNNNRRISSIISDIPTIDKDDNQIGISKTKDYNIKNKDNIIALELLWLGRNLFVDMAFHRKEVFLKSVYNNYLLWNGPFFLNLDNNTITNFQKVSFPFFKYRLGDNNYQNDKTSSYNIINGEIRVVTRLLKNYHIPLYKLQYIIFRIYNKLKLTKYYKVIYKKEETKDKYPIIKFVLNKRFTDEEIKNNTYLRSILSFYQNPKERKITLTLNKEPIYYGKDMRIFNKKLRDNKLEPLYQELMEEMEIGFNQIEVEEKDYQKVEDITKFFCIYPYVKITIRKEKKHDQK